MYKKKLKHKTGVFRDAMADSSSKCNKRYCRTFGDLKAHVLTKSLIIMTKKLCLLKKKKQSTRA